MDEFERAITERQETIRRLEKEIAQAKIVLANAQTDLSVLLSARQIVHREKLMNEHVASASQLSFAGNLDKEIIPKEGSTSFSAGDAHIAPSLNEVRPIRDLTLVDEVRAILSESPLPLGPSEIRKELAKTGRIVPQNVMTGILSRLNKENRVKRLERGKYILVTQEERMEKQTA
ncbi:MAG: hypothetical protein A4E19_01390 [Nitrospira sp. SG-bin1]|nr:MAG: hypothetical protein A4E19_01390 [Nitrospira sp. SG-bin1]